ncbi:hypothetical protein F2Q69_00014383 [Brassica cretica]|uniref:Uncharacterized protein n=1 Tax=Brassica cretica TaxID=69181 RepID=A0A8S9QZT2_BRACR|nr:hypothetical protein F2Q69_00014383 [Brassica cretica]
MSAGQHNNIALSRIHEQLIPTPRCHCLMTVERHAYVIRKTTVLDVMRRLLQDNDLSEFDEARDIIESLVYEYKASLTGEGNASGVVDPKLAF